MLLFELVVVGILPVVGGVVDDSVVVAASI